MASEKKDEGNLIQEVGLSCLFVLPLGICALASCKLIDALSKQSSILAGTAVGYFALAFCFVLAPVTILTINHFIRSKKK